MSCLARGGSSASAAVALGSGRGASHTEAMPDDAPWIDPVVVPDDLRELQADIESYHRERRQAARRRRIARLTGGIPLRQLLLPVGIAAGAMSLAAVVFTILMIGHPRSQPAPPQAPVAADPIGDVGELNGLLPDVTVRIGGGETSIRDLRPALVALVPVPCRCTDLLGRLAAQADEMSLPLVVVAPTAQDAEVDALDGQLHRGHVTPAFDADGRLADTYSASGVTAVLVGADATVRHVRTDVTPDVRFEMLLQQLSKPIATDNGNTERG
jgi:hypothetical protein